MNAKELFNLRHSSLRNAVERILGATKKRFPILKVAPPYTFEVQVDLVLAVCFLHNFISIHSENNGDFQLTVEELRDLEDEAEERRQTRIAGDPISTNAARVAGNQVRDSIAEQMWKDYQDELNRRSCRK